MKEPIKLEYFSTHMAQQTDQITLRIPNDGQSFPDFHNKF